MGRIQTFSINLSNSLQVEVQARLTFPQLGIEGRFPTLERLLCQLLTIDTTVQPARITQAHTITRNGNAAQLLDLEGIASDGEGGFWLASEGRSDRLIPHAIYHVNAQGEIQRQIPFPSELLAVE